MIPGSKQCDDMIARKGKRNKVGYNTGEGEFAKIIHNALASVLHLDICDIDKYLKNLCSIQKIVKKKV